MLGCLGEEEKEKRDDQRRECYMIDLTSVCRDANKQAVYFQSGLYGPVRVAYCKYCT